MSKRSRAVVLASKRRLKNTEDAKLGISTAIVGVSDRVGRAKMTYDYFLPPFERTLAALDFKVRHYSYREFILTGQPHDAAILLYGEVRAQRHPQFLNVLEGAATAARARKTLVVHAPSVGKIVADKTSTNKILSKGGVEVPRLVSTTLAPFKVFSNENMGSHAPAHIVNVGKTLDGSRYNTEWIDTRHNYNGRDYYVVLRAMAVGSRCTSILLRMRPVDDGDASVHNTDTPLNASLWNDLYQRIVVPQSGAIQTICEQIANILGLGFFSHDILPEQHSSRLLVCETGFKFDDYLYRSHFMPLSGKLVADDFLSERFVKKSAECFASELVKQLDSTRQDRQ
jgi:hypothetical protein